MEMTDSNNDDANNYDNRDREYFRISQYSCIL